MIKKLLFLGLLSLNAVTLQAVVAVGDTPDSTTTFQFSVGSAIYNALNSQLWTLSGEDISAQPATIQEYGISYTQFIAIDGSLGTTLTAYPYLTSQALITTTDSGGAFVTPGDPVDNPLLGQAYSAVTFLGANLVTVNTLSPRYIYLIQSSNFYDAALGKNSPEGMSIINQLDLGATHEVKFLAGSGSGVLFFAQALGTFGTTSSYISFAASQTTNYAINGQNKAYTTIVHQADEPVTLSTPVLIADSPTGALSAIGSSITMYPSPITAYQMYVGLDVTAHAGDPANCAAGLFAATSTFATDSTPASLVFSSVLPDDVTGGAFETPVSATSSHRVVVSNVTATTTSTGLTYFITARYSQTEEQSIYAMPMVTMSSNPLENGMVASIDSIAQVFKIIGSTYRVQGFDTVISDPSEINILGLAPVVARIQVGGGPVPLPAGTFIDQLSALGDAVYITIHNPFGVGSTPGLFKSQALFDAQGRIMSWTPWQRVAGTDDQMLFAVKNRTTDATMYVSGANSDTIEQTVWNNTTDLTSCISATIAAMPIINGGVQALIPVSNATTNLSNFPLVVTSGNEAVVITQTGHVTDGNVIMDTPTQNTATLNSALGLDIGSVVTATFANNSVTGNNWFFMGGDSGLSVLSDDTTGYAFDEELTSLATLTASGMSCKTLGNFKFVKKVMSDSNFVYVATPDAIYRIALAANKFTLTSPAALNAELVVRASAIDSYANFTDMIVDSDLLLLGSTAGLYSVDAAGVLPATPTAITIPGGLPTVSRLMTVSTNANFDQKFYVSSNLYVLTINYVLQQARLNRFTITDGVVTPIQDQLLEGQDGPLLNFAYMSNNIFIDGSLGFATSYRIGSIPPMIKYMEYTLQAGKSSSQLLLNAHTADLAIAAVVNSLGITGIARDYASGCLMLTTNFGLLTDS